LIDPGAAALSIRQQCELLGLNRASYYYEPAPETRENLRLMRLIDEEYMRHPFLGSRRMTDYLSRQGEFVNRKRIQRLMRMMGIEALYPKPRLSKPHPEHKVYPYLLRDRSITAVNQVWSTDVTYVPMPCGFMYLVAVMDWYSRYVLAWQLSNTLDGHFCLDTLEQALERGSPEIFNTDQGCQFTARRFTGRLEAEHILVSMDGRGRALDNIFIERLWRSVKYEDLYLKSYEDVPGLDSGLRTYFAYYNEERPHQSLGYKTPAEVHYGLA
jgi:putative transposase